jgi:hypothetical protein
MSTSQHLEIAVRASRGDLRTAIRLLANSRAPEGRAAHRILIGRSRRFAGWTGGAIATRVAIRACDGFAEVFTPSVSWFDAMRMAPASAA